MTNKYSNIYLDENGIYPCSSFVSCKKFTLLMRLITTGVSFQKIEKYLNKNIHELNKQNELGGTALMFAAWYSSTVSNINIVRLLLDKGAEINTKDNLGWTALQYAVEFSNSSSNIKTVKLLLERGADVNCVTSSGRSIITQINSSLMRPNSEIAELLLARDVDLNFKNMYGDTILHIFVKDNNIDIVRKILNKNYVIDSQNNMGATPLITAITQQYFDIAKLLLKKGANPNLLNVNGESALTNLLKKDYTTIIKQIKILEHICSWNLIKENSELKRENETLKEINNFYEQSLALHPNGDAIIELKKDFFEKNTQF
jgi:ankyrin repeat protein